MHQGVARPGHEIPNNLAEVRSRALGVSETGPERGVGVIDCGDPVADRGGQVHKDGVDEGGAAVRDQTESATAAGEEPEAEHPGGGQREVADPEPGPELDLDAEQVAPEDQLVEEREVGAGKDASLLLTLEVLHRPDLRDLEGDGEEGELGVAEHQDDQP